MENLKRASVIESAIQAVAESGFHQASISMIASGAGVAAGTIYLHFENKDHLMLETYRELVRRCLATVMKKYPDEGSIRQRFFHLIQGFTRHCMLFSEEFLFLDQFFSSPYRKAPICRVLPVEGAPAILELLQEGVEKRLFRKMPPIALLALMCGPVIQVMRAGSAGIISLDDITISGTAEACWDAVCHQKMPCAPSPVDQFFL